MAANSAQKSVNKVAKKVDALTKKWTVDNPAPYWNELSAKNKQNILNAAKKNYMAKFMKQLNLPQDLPAQDPSAPPAKDAPQGGPPSPDKVINQLK